MNEHETTITDVNIPFGRMILIILKFMLASIPAVLLMYVIMIPVMLLFAAIMGGGFATLSHFGP